MNKASVIMITVVIAGMLAACSSLPSSLTDKHVRKYEAETGFHMRVGEIKDYIVMGKKQRIAYIEYYSQGDGKWYGYSFVTFIKKDGKWIEK